MAAHPVFLPGKPQGQRSLLGHSPRGRKESDTTERLSSSEPDQHGGAAGADSRPRGRLESGDTRGSWPAGAVVSLSSFIPMFHFKEEMLTYLILCQKSFLNTR